MTKEKKMTDRIYALTVILEKDIREDDIEFTINAIRMIKGVLSVDSLVSDIVNYAAEVRIRRELGDKLRKILEEEET